MNGIHTIKIKNFKAFPVEQVFVLNGNHLLIYGENGSGKSSLYFALYTLLQCSDKTKDATKYFTRNNPQNLLNIFSKDDDGWIDISFQNETEKFYRLSVSGLIPNEVEDIIIKEANLASDFISHRLLINIYNFRNSKEINLFSVFERDILPFIPTSTGENFLSIYNEISANKPYRLRENGVIARRAITEIEFVNYQERIKFFSEELERLVENINEKVTDFYAQYFNDGKKDIRIKLQLTQKLAFELISEERKFDEAVHIYTSEDFWILKVPFVKLFIQHKVGEEYKDIDRPQSFLNEAKLTAIALAIRFSVLDDKLQTENAKILALDDLLISLDMTHREVVLDLLFTKYAPKFQILLFTHDRAFFNLARKRIKFRFDDDGWNFYEMYSDLKDEIPLPKVLISGSHYAKAKEHLLQKDYPACANYLRKDIEGKLKLLLPDKLRRRKDGSKISLLGELLPKAYQYFETMNFNSSILDEIETYKGILLNPLSHDNAESEIYKVDLHKTFKIIDDLSQIRNEIIIPVDKQIKFTINATSGKRFEFTLVLTDDLRLIKKNDLEDSFIGKITGDVISCFETGIDNSVTEYKYEKPHPYKNKSLQEIFNQSSHAVAHKKKEAIITKVSLDEIFVTEDGKTFKELMKY